MHLIDLQPCALAAALVTVCSLPAPRIHVGTWAADEPMTAAAGISNTTVGVASAAETAPDAELKLRQDMRKLWSDHVIWTRCYIIASVDGQPDQKAAAARLMKNQEDIGDAIAPFYGKEADEKLTGLLKEHIQIAVDLINAAKAKDDAKVKELDRNWQRNAKDIAAFLSAANPHWPEATLAEMMNTHLTTTTVEVTARLEQKWDRDVKAFDEVYDHILDMADALSDGIVKQFPEKFSSGGGPGR
jgi:hypothetical protein